MSARRSVGAIAAAAVAVALLLAGWAVASSPVGGNAAQREARCGEADAGVEHVSRSGLRKAVLCLTNKARAQHGTDRLGRDDELQKAAQRHANVMSQTGCLASRCPGEPDLEDRISKAGYFEEARKWAYAENSGCAVSAAAMVESWLESSVHRSNLLKSKFRDLGVGIVEKGPEIRCDEGLGVFSAVLAWRKP